MVRHDLIEMEFLNIWWIRINSIELRRCSQNDVKIIVLVQKQKKKFSKFWTLQRVMFFLYHPFNNLRNDENI